MELNQEEYREYLKNTFKVTGLQEILRRNEIKFSEDARRTELENLILENIQLENTQAYLKSNKRKRWTVIGVLGFLAIIAGLNADMPVFWNRITSVFVGNSIYIQESNNALVQKYEFTIFSNYPENDINLLIANEIKSYFNILNINADISIIDENSWAVNNNQLDPLGFYIKTNVTQNSTHVFDIEWKVIPNLPSLSYYQYSNLNYLMPREKAEEALSNLYKGGIECILPLNNELESFKTALLQEELSGSNSKNFEFNIETDNVSVIREILLEEVVLVLSNQLLLDRFIPTNQTNKIRLKEFLNNYDNENTRNFIQAYAEGDFSFLQDTLYSYISEFEEMLITDTPNWTKLDSLANTFSPSSYCPEFFRALYEPCDTCIYLDNKEINHLLQAMNSEKLDFSKSILRQELHPMVEFAQLSDLVSKGELLTAYNKFNAVKLNDVSFEKNGIKVKLSKNSFWYLYIEILKGLCEDEDLILSSCDSMIANEPYNPNSYIRKYFLLKDFGHDTKELARRAKKHCLDSRFFIFQEFKESFNTDSEKAKKLYRELEQKEIYPTDRFRLYEYVVNNYDNLQFLEPSYISIIPRWIQ